jgi:DHA2 family lincomycin resistance protein-like MFS transporter
VMAAANSAATEAGADALTAGAAGTHAAFLTAAFLSLPLLVGAFLIRKPADQPMGAPVAH